MRFVGSFLLLFFLSGLPAQSDGFEIQEAEDGIELSTREEDNGEMSVRIRTTSPASLARAVAVLDDVGRYPEWVNRCERARIVSGTPATGFTYQSVIDLPFPIRNKDVVAYCEQRYFANGTAWTRTISSTPDAYPQEKGVERLRVYEAEWQLRELAGGANAGAGHLELQCTVRTDAGAGLPGWIRREVLTGGPLRTVANLRTQLVRGG